MEGKERTRSPGVGVIGGLSHRTQVLQTTFQSMSGDISPAPNAPLQWYTLQAL